MSADTQGDRSSNIEHSQDDVDALVDFWHARNDGKLLDDHAREVLDGLAVTRRLTGAVEDRDALAHALSRIASKDPPMGIVKARQIAQAALRCHPGGQ